MKVEGSDDESNSRRFDAHIGPVRDALLEMLDGALRLTDQWGFMPAAASLAMSELADEQKHRGSAGWGAHPVTEAHNAAHLLLIGADDIARSMCRLVEVGNPPPVFGHIVLGGLRLNMRAEPFGCLSQPHLAYESLGVSTSGWQVLNSRNVSETLRRTTPRSVESRPSWLKQNGLAFENFLPNVAGHPKLKKNVRPRHY